jgi:hypothetical protein
MIGRFEEVINVKTGVAVILVLATPHRVWFSFASFVIAPRFE